MADITHMIVATANVTDNVTMEASYTFEGKLARDVSYLYDPEIYDHYVSGAKGTSMIVVRCNATLRPSKAAKYLFS